MPLALSVASPRACTTGSTRATASLKAVSAMHAAAAKSARSDHTTASQWLSQQSLLGTANNITPSVCQRLSQQRVSVAAFVYKSPPHTRDCVNSP